MTITHDFDKIPDHVVKVFTDVGLIINKDIEFVEGPVPEKDGYLYKVKPLTKKAKKLFYGTN